MIEFKQLPIETYQRMKEIVNNYQITYKPLEKIELDNKQVFLLRRAIKNEKATGYDNKLRTITLYKQNKDEILKLYINKLYQDYFPNN
jgi:hypothetical protein